MVFRKQKESAGTRRFSVDLQNGKTIRHALIWYHTIQVNHWSLWSGRVHIYVDDELIFERRRKIFDSGLEHRFKVDGLPYIIRIFIRAWRTEYELWVDGKLQ